MKVLDMLGSGLPVCAYRYPAIGELVEHGHNGCVFGSSDELKEQIMRLLIMPLDGGGAGGGGVVDAAEAAALSCGNGGMHHRTMIQHCDAYGASTQNVDTDNDQHLDEAAAADVRHHQHHDDDEDDDEDEDEEDAFKELSRLGEASSQIGCWEDNWSAVVAPLLDGIMNEIIRSL